MVHSIIIQENYEVIVIEDSPDDDDGTPRLHTITMQQPREVIVIDEPAPLVVVIDEPAPLVVVQETEGPTAGELLFNRGMLLAPTLGELRYNQAMFSDGHDNNVGVDTLGSHVLQGNFDFYHGR
jgi:hypothetical protein